MTTVTKLEGFYLMLEATTLFYGQGMAGLSILDTDSRLLAYTVVTAFVLAVNVSHHDYP